jgi:uncharacterized membrane protein
MIAIVFSDRNSAQAAVRVLHDLNGAPRLLVRTVRLIKKEQNASATEERADDDFPPPSGTLAGIALGAVIGLLGGYLLAAIGASVGAVIGLLRDLNESELQSKFMVQVSNAMVPGTYAVLTEVEEYDTATINAPMEDLGGVVFRVRRAPLLPGYGAREAALYRQELEAMTAGLAQAARRGETGIRRAIHRVQAQLRRSAATHHG